MKVRDVQQILSENGFVIVRRKGSHTIYRGTVRGRTRIVVVPGNRGSNIPNGTLASIRRQAGLGRRVFR